MKSAINSAGPKISMNESDVIAKDGRWFNLNLISIFIGFEIIIVVIFTFWGLIVFQNKPKGLPGNDDTGTMSAWLVYSMMGIYPLSPGEPKYAITIPMFDKITIQLNSKYYKKKELVIEKVTNNNGFIKFLCQFF